MSWKGPQGSAPFFYSQIFIENLHTDSKEYKILAKFRASKVSREFKLGQKQNKTK